MQNHLTKIISALALLLLLTQLGTHQTLAAPQSGGSITVDSTGDGNSKSPYLSLHEAILISNGGTGPNGLNRTLSDGEKFELSGCTLSGSTNNWSITGGCGAGFLDTINFNFLLPGLQTITLTASLPALTDPVIIDGYSIIGSHPNTALRGDNAVRPVAIDGNAHNALTISGGNSIVQGLDISNSTYGIYLTTNGSNIIRGNRIQRGYSASAIGIHSGTFNTIGGGSPDARNILTDYETGIEVEPAADSTNIQGNLIGADASGQHGKGNDTAGITLLSSHNTVGGTGANMLGNVIAFNSGQGIRVILGAENYFSANSIFSNGIVGLDLGDNGVTPNNSGIAENNGQNYPVLKRATGATRKIKGKIQGQAEATVVIEFFSSPTCSKSKYGEGKTYLGNVFVKIAANGYGKFNQLVKHFQPGQAITATATDENSNTSEFSKCKFAS